MEEEDEKLLLILYGGRVGNMPAAATFGAVIVARPRNFVDWKSLFDGFFHLLYHGRWWTATSFW